MIVAVVTLAVLVVIMSVLFLVACCKIERVQADSRARDIQHDQCVEHVAALVSAEHAASVLRQAATKWDSVENRAHLTAMRNRWQPGDEGVAAQWMREQAEEYVRE